ncbi:MAG: MFS transporter, partial [Anaerolineae bacterium]
MFPRFALYGFLKNLRFFDPFLILIFREAGLSFLQIGSLYAVRDVATNLLEVPTGVFADAFGRRKSMLMAFGAYIVSFLVFYALAGFGWYALAMVFFAFGEAFRSGTHKALILEYLRLTGRENEKVSYYGRTRSASQFGSAVNALIAAGLVFYTGHYRTMFLAATVPYVLDFINLLTYPPELDGELRQVHADAIWEQTRATLHDFKRMFTEPHALRAIGNSAAFSALFKAAKDYLQPIMESFALSLPLFLALSDKRRSALVIGAVYFVIYLATSYASRSADRFSRRFSSLGRAINLSFLLGAGLLILAGFATWVNLTILAIAAFLGFYVLHNLRRPMNVAFISDQIASRVMASGLSVESQGTTLLTAGFALLLGALADALGVGTALAALGALTLLLYALIRVQE